MFHLIIKRAVKLLALLLIISYFSSISYSQLKSDTTLIRNQTFQLINSTRLNIPSQNTENNNQSSVSSSKSNVDTAEIRKEILQVLKKHGLKDISFLINVKSLNQKGGQTAFEISNYNYKNTFNIKEEHTVNGNNFGVNGNVYSERSLTKNEKDSLLKYVENAKKIYGIKTNCVSITITNYSNGQKIASEISEFLKAKGYNIGSVGTAYTSDILNGISIEKGIYDCIGITIGIL